jgi:outer membrane protein assembly factor BamB
MLYVNTLRGHTYAIVASSGKVRWKREISGEKPSTPAIDGSRLVVSSKDGTVTALDRETGRLLWQIQTNSGVESSPVVVDGLVYFGAHDGRVFAVSSRTGHIVALDARNGRILWTHSVGGWGYATPAVTPKRILIGGFDGNLRAFDPATGRELWRADAGGKILGSPVVVGRLVFVTTTDQKTYALRVENGRAVWHLSMGKYTPVIATERTYYFSLFGRLLAFRGQHAPPASR